MFGVVRRRRRSATRRRRRSRAQRLSRRSTGSPTDRRCGETQYTFLKHFFGRARERDLIAHRPLEIVRPPKPGAARERVLDDDEIARLWPIEGAMADIARLALLTAQRKGSIEAMRWTDLDLARASWTIPGARMKSAKLHVVPLSGPAVAILTRRPRLGGPFVFGVGSGGAAPYSGGSNGLEHLRGKVSDTPWRLHDLRRTAVTLAQRGGGSIEESRALTQHKLPGVIGVYARHAYTDEKRRVVAIIAAEIDAAITGGVSRRAGRSSRRRRRRRRARRSSRG